MTTTKLIEAAQALLPDHYGPMTKVEERVAAFDTSKAK